jgi:hypothetical protein
MEDSDGWRAVGRVDKRQERREATASAQPPWGWKQRQVGASQEMDGGQGGGGGKRVWAKGAQRAVGSRSHKGREGIRLTRMDGNEVVGWALVEQSSGMCA